MKSLKIYNTNLNLKEISDQWPVEIIIISIDPGYVNCGIRIEKRNRNTNLVTPLFFDILNFTNGKKKYNDIFLTKNFNEFVYKENIHQYFLDSHLILIEQQMKKNKILKFAQHMVSFLSGLFYNNNTKAIISISPKLKNRIMLDDKTKNIKRNRRKILKKCSVIKAKQLLEERQELENLKKIEYWESKKSKRADDLSDTICQIEGFFDKFSKYLMIK